MSRRSLVIATLATATLVAASGLATPPRRSIVLDGRPFTVRLSPSGRGPSQPAGPGAAPPSELAHVVAGPSHYRLVRGRQSRRLPLDVRSWTLVAWTGGDGGSTVLRGEEAGENSVPYKRVSADGRISSFELPGPRPANRHVICGARYLVGVARLGTTLIHDLEEGRLVRRDGQAGVHARADHYGGPSCSPDGRYVAVPDTFAKTVYVFRLADGARIAHVDADGDGYVPGFVTWSEGAEPGLEIWTVPDPIAVNPPR